MQGISFISRPQIQDSINATRARIKRIHDRMTSKRNEAVIVDDIEIIRLKMYEYQKLNDELKRAKIYEAELVYLRNML